MSLQYISDSKGEPTGVYIPIKDWNRLKEKYKDIEKDEIEIPQWQKDIVLDRIKNTKQDSYLSWDDLEKQIKFE